MTTTARRTLLIAFALAFVGAFLLVLLQSATRSYRLIGGGGESVPAIEGGSPSFLIRGDLDVGLSPGRSAGLDLELSNPLDENLVISDIRISVDAVKTPSAVDGLPCSVGDFAVTQSIGEVTLDARATAQLSVLGLEPAEWPQVGMRETGLNQDGCKGASLTLGYSAVGEVRG